MLPAQAPAYHFTVGGKEVTARIVSLAGTPESPAPGDLVEFGHMLWLRLEQPGEYAWTNLWRRDRVERAGTLVATNEYLLPRLDDAALRNLRGVRLTWWNDAVAAQINRLPADVPVVLAAAAMRDGLPPLPPFTRHLWLELGRDGPRGLAHASALADLRTLRIDGVANRAFDVSAFGEAKELRWLHLRGLLVRDGTTIHRFGELRTFVAEDVAVEASWLSLAKNLRRVEIRGGSLDSLVPLSLLPELRHVVVQRRHVDDDVDDVVETEGREPTPPDLPSSGFRNLEVLDLTESPIEVAQVRAFHAAHPRCTIRGVVLPELLTDLLARADRMVVRGGARRILLDTEDPTEIRRVAALLRVQLGDRRGPLRHPELAIVFSAAGTNIAALHLQGDALEWDDGPWQGSSALDEATLEPLRAWIAAIAGGTK